MMQPVAHPVAMCSVHAGSVHPVAGATTLAPCCNTPTVDCCAGHKPSPHIRGAAWQVAKALMEQCQRHRQFAAVKNHIVAAPPHALGEKSHLNI